MPPKRNNPEPPPKVMTWKKASWVLVICAIFDALRLMFEFFWFFGPALAAFYCTVKAGGGAVGGFLCSTAAATIGIIGSPAITIFGIVMAMATGFAGWLAVGIILLRFNSRIFEENAMWFAGSLLISEIPIIGSVPAITIIVWKMYRTQIRIETAKMKKYEEEQEAQRMQAQAANDDQYTQKLDKAA